MPIDSQIISDLHLCRNRPDLFALFRHFMLNIAPNSKILYVLGDLFEVWIGDDCLNQDSDDSHFNLEVIKLFRQYSDNGNNLYFIHGNRDFLLGKTFEKMTGGSLITEPFSIKFGKHQTILMHGDSLCIDDIAYQEFRAMVRNPKWQAQLLSLSIEERIKIATGLRQQSKQAQSEKTMQIMDVNQQAVIEFFIEHKIDWLIHGHTHRQANHKFEINNKSVQRIVLSDWDKQGFYLTIADNNCESHYFDDNPELVN